MVSQKNKEQIDEINSLIKKAFDKCVELIKSVEEVNTRGGQQLAANTLLKAAKEIDRETFLKLREAFPNQKVWDEVYGVLSDNWPGEFLVPHLVGFVHSGFLALYVSKETLDFLQESLREIKISRGEDNH
ncbi:MAG: hypothetical protein ABH831_01510 [Candidatus Nealsonbacteria bacterium]